MATSNDGSSSGEDREAAEVTPASFHVTRTPLQPASIETIMARLAQQDAAHKAATDQIAALAKILAPPHCERGSFDGAVPKTSV